MAVTKIKPIRGTVNKALAYILDPKKTDDEHKSNKKSNDKPTIETLFNSGMKIHLDGASFSPIELDFFADDYKYNSSQQAVGNNCLAS